MDFTKDQAESKIIKTAHKVGDALKAKKTAMLRVADLPDTVKQGISDGVAMNALFGNVDVNAKGNFGITGLEVKDGKIVKGNAAILDFGHEFNNLIAGSKAFGVGVGHENGILDFINRDKVLKAPRGAKSKLWRDYKGLIPSELFANSLEKIGASQKKLLEGVEQAQAKIQAMVGSMEDKSILALSLQRLNRNVGKKDVQFNSVDDMIKITMGNLKEFSVKLTTEMKEVAQLMRLKLDIDKEVAQAQKENRDVNFRQFEKTFAEVSKGKQEKRWHQETGQFGLRIKTGRG